MKIKEIKDPTVKDLIEHLKTLDQDAKVCKMVYEDGGFIHTSIETCEEIDGQSYWDDKGDLVTGKIVSLC